ncbi:MAG: TonB-dependent receptor [Bacteroidales bacterium]|nr:TonB-dependent receptor [Bacteroidales bacterium]MCF8337932.1 TonB-dependent receptor [Bacteroidales bacterium]
MKHKIPNLIRAGIVPLLLLMSVSLMAQQRTISGTVSDAQTGETLPGANIVVKGTQTGTISGADGGFTLEIGEDAETLVVSFIGYQKKEVNIGDRTTFDIALKRKAESLEEVVVIGYGTVKKSDLTGSVSSVKGEELTKISSSSPLDAMQGKMAGAQISSSSGEPGANPIVRVRGVGTLNNANPIYVVDGVIVDDISFLSSNDIESVELLKDASATAIYGSRGANGVFIITTKSGGDGMEPSISFKTEFGTQDLRNRIDLLNGEEFARALNDISPGTINNIDAVDSYDWQDAIFQENPMMQSYDLSVSGGNDKMNYYLGTGVYDREGIIPKSQYRRYNLKLNTKYKARDYLTFGANISGAYTNDENAPNVVGSAYRAWPIDTPYNADGSFAEVRGNGNPLAAIEYTNSTTKSYRLVGNIFTEIKFLKNLRFKSSYQFDLRHSKNRSFSPEYFVSPTQQNSRNSLSINFTEDRRWIWENTINYDLDVENHTINAVAGFTAQEQFYESPNITMYRLVRENPLFWHFSASLTDTVDVSSGLGDAYKNTMLSALFRTNYSYKDKYLATVSFRADGSSKFAKEDRYGYFPSFALGWNASNEPFFPDWKAVNHFKIRGSWGIIGNEKINWYDRFSLIGSNYGAVFGQPETIQPGATFFSAGNNDLLWENTKQTNIGIEFGLYDDKLTGGVDYYRKQTEDILVMLDVPGYFGFGSFQRVRFNAASVLNSGLEFNFSFQDQIGNVKYGINASGSTVHNEVTALGANTPTDSVIFGGNLSNGDRITATRVGEPIGYFYGYEIEGVFQNESELEQYPHLSNQDVGDFIYRDQNGDGEITPDGDRTKIGSPIPDFTFGMGFNVSYKNISLSMDFQGQVGNEIYNAKNQTRFGIYNFEQRVLDRWTSEGTSDYEPELDGKAGNYEQSEYFVEDGSYLRLRSAVLSYTFPERWMKKAGFSSANIYIRGTNLFTLTDYSGYSPDLGGSPLSSGIDSGIYPITSVYTMGINLKL